MFGVGHTELLVVAFVALILFGNRLPKVMRSLGQSVNEFRHGLHSTDEA
ncbi:MAG: twin-arginine translocase TatA/TatE family subunit [Planctomycetaceae bacterium]|nr:twin-arginine translocase TatA/TatE family subunit [Planctomycetales bacterium]MCB9941812.1 twin-arginine translocase TatA/TatE family subunit [Planctomycetaceae bacterium]